MALAALMQRWLVVGARYIVPLPKNSMFAPKQALASSSAEWKVALINLENSPYADLLAPLRGRLIVSCQARESEPLRDPYIMAAMAQAAVMGGAVGIRANGADDIRAIKQ